VLVPAFMLSELRAAFVAGLRYEDLPLAVVAMN